MITLQRIERTTRDWSNVAASFGLDNDAITAMRPAVDNPDRVRVTALTHQDADPDDPTGDHAGTIQRPGATWVMSHLRGGRHVTDYWSEGGHG